MADFVSRSKVEFELCGGNLPEKYKEFIRRVLNDKNLIPAADVAPVVHGRWVHHDDGVVTCSECGNAESCEGCYCSYCGAKMDGGDLDGR